MTKQDHHEKAQSKSKTKAKRSTRTAANPENKKKNYKAGPGRPKGSAVSKTTGLTPNQEKIAQEMIEAEVEGGLWPASVRELADATGQTPQKIRLLLKKPEFQAYLLHLLDLEGVVMEGAFWRGLALGLQAADVKALELYARMTGKIRPVQKESKVEVTIKGADGLQLPEYVDEAIEAEVVEEVFDD